MRDERFSTRRPVLHGAHHPRLALVPADGGGGVRALARRGADRGEALHAAHHPAHARPHPRAAALQEPRSRAPLLLLRIFLLYATTYCTCFPFDRTHRSFHPLHIIVCFPFARRLDLFSTRIEHCCSVAVRYECINNAIKYCTIQYSTVQ